MKDKDFIETTIRAMGELDGYQDHPVFEEYAAEIEAFAHAIHWAKEEEQIEHMRSLAKILFALGHQANSIRVTTGDGE